MEAQPEVKRPAALSLTGKRVLVVDSSAGSRLLISRYLSLWNCSSEEASSASEATEKLQRPKARVLEGLTCEFENARDAITLFLDEPN